MKEIHRSTYMPENQLGRLRIGSLLFDHGILSFSLRNEQCNRFFNDHAEAHNVHLTVREGAKNAYNVSQHRMKSLKMQQKVPRLKHLQRD